VAEILKTERILNLVYLLLKERRPVPWATIRRDVVGYNNTQEDDASVERRFDRDKATVRELGIDIKYTQDDGEGNAGYFIERQRYFLPRLELSAEEVATMALAGAAAPASHVLGEALRSALSKLQFDSPIPGDVRATVEERYLFYHHCMEEGPGENIRLETLTEAALRNKTVTFAYRREEDAVSARRSVDPYGLSFWSGRWYLTGYCHDRKAIRTFRVDRISEDITLARPATSPDFVVPDSFDVKDYVGQPPWQIRGDHRVRVVLRLDSTVAWMVRDQSQKDDVWRNNADGSATLERSVANPEALMRWALSFGAHAEIVAPAEMRDHFVRVLKDVRSRYAGLPMRRGH
jgi:proteasome accessory factor BC